MRKNIPEKVIDVTGVELTPGEPTVCLGNGEQGFELCCDECDYFLLCFPEYDPKNENEPWYWKASKSDDCVKPKETQGND